MVCRKNKHEDNSVSVKQSENKNRAKPENILVILGGVSSEREVSLQTGQACVDALNKRGYKVRVFDWQKREATQLLQAITTPTPDVAFNALHGTCGEDGCLYGLMECCAIPTTHSATLASAIAMDKLMTKQLLEQSGIRFPESMKLEVAVGNERQESPIPVPYVIKPIAQGSSIGVVRNLEKRKPLPSSRQFPLMIERYIHGREFTVGVFKGTALGITEVIARQGEFYDYKAKYNEEMAASHVFPAKIEHKLATKICKWAELAHKNLGCRVISRCDFRYNPQEPEEKNLYMLEINTHPGMTGMSLVPEQARGVGIEFEEIIETLVLDAWQKKEHKGKRYEAAN